MITFASILISPGKTVKAMKAHPVWSDPGFVNIYAIIWGFGIITYTNSLIKPFELADSCGAIFQIVGLYTVGWLFGLFVLYISGYIIAFLKRKGSGADISDDSHQARCLVAWSFIPVIWITLLILFPGHLYFQDNMFTKQLPYTIPSLLQLYDSSIVFIVTICQLWGIIILFQGIKQLYEYTIIKSLLIILFFLVLQSASAYLLALLAKPLYI
jgi:hypothetical protein